MLKRVGIEFERYRIFEAQPSSLSHPRVHVFKMDEETLRTTESRELRALTEYAGLQAIGFAASFDGALAAACWYWYGERYRTRGFVTLPPSGAKLVQITTARQFRGHGIAPTLIAHSARQMAAEGFTTLLARVWHSHKASCAAFRKAGWREVEVITAINVHGIKQVRWSNRAFQGQRR